MDIKWLTDEQVKELKERGFELSDSFDTVEEALKYVAKLREINRDPSFMVSVAGLYANLDHYPQVIFKYTVL